MRKTTMRCCRCRPDLGPCGMRRGAGHPRRTGGLIGAGAGAALGAATGGNAGTGALIGGGVGAIGGAADARALNGRDG